MAIGADSWPEVGSDSNSLPVTNPTKLRWRGLLEANQLVGVGEAVKVEGESVGLPLPHDENELASEVGEGGSKDDARGSSKLPVCLANSSVRHFSEQKRPPGVVCFPQWHQSSNIVAIGTLGGWGFLEGCL
jgi:hypothetical protein